MTSDAQYTAMKQLLLEEFEWYLVRMVDPKDNRWGSYTKGQYKPPEVTVYAGCFSLADLKIMEAVYTKRYPHFKFKRIRNVEGYPLLRKADIKCKEDRKKHIERMKEKTKLVEERLKKKIKKKIVRTIYGTRGKDHLWKDTKEEFKVKRRLIVKKKPKPTNEDTC